MVALLQIKHDHDKNNSHHTPVLDEADSERAAAEAAGTSAERAVQILNEHDDMSEIKAADNTMHMWNGHRRVN